VVSYLDVIVTQAADLSIRRDAVSIATRRMVASVQLVKALGGGWTAPNREDAAPIAGRSTP
jgi:outer membrane protein TolC